MKNVAIHLNLPVTFLRENKRYVAYTPALDLSTSGRSYKEAKRRFEELVQVFIDELVKHNTLPNVLKEQGWKEIRNEWHPPVVVSQETVSVLA